MATRAARWVLGATEQPNAQVFLGIGLNKPKVAQPFQGFGQENNVWESKSYLLKVPPLLSLSTVEYC